jgi:tetratricopeptide (TPR) repeat protein
MPIRATLIFLTLLLSAFIYFAPSQINPKGDDSDQSSHPDEVDPTGLDAEALLASASAALDSSGKSTLAGLTDKWKESGSETDTALMRRIGLLWDQNGIAAASAIWFERRAKAAPAEQTYLEAAYRYFDAFRMAGDSSLRSILIAKAIGAYSKVLEFNPDNLNAKTDLGACYADGTSEPMKGIMMLREVVEKDPNHEMAQYNLGMLSVKSGQLDKAIERFNKVLTINPARHEVHYYLGQVFLQKGDTTTAIREYELFIKSAPYDVSELIKTVEDLKKKSS